MKKIVILTLSLVLTYSFAFASVVVLDPLPISNSDSFLHDYGMLSLGNQYKTKDIYLMNGLGNFIHTYEFSIPAAGVNVSSDPFNINFGGQTLNITNFFAGLFNSNDIERGSGQSFSVSNLLAGDYYIKISGIVDGTLGGSYNMDFSTKPVPLPGAALFLGAGLLGLVGLRRRQM